MKRILLFLTPLLFLYQSCSQSNSTAKENVSEKDIVATIDGQSVSTSSLDALIQDQLYESLFGIYYKRKIALDEYLAERVVQMEAKRTGISRDSLVAAAIGKGTREKSIEKYIEENHLESGTPDPENPLKVIDIKTPEGKLFLEKSYRNKLHQEYVESLMEKYQVKISLNPPLAPKKDFSKVYRLPSLQDEKGEFTVQIVSDFDCPTCQNMHPVFKQLREKYQDRVDFIYSPLSTQPTLPLVIAELGNSTGNFWEIHDKLFQTTQKDSASWLQIAQEFKLNKNKFSETATALGEKLNRNYELLNGHGINMTPTLIIDDRIFYGDHTLEKLSDYIEGQLKAKKAL